MPKEFERLHQWFNLSVFFTGWDAELAVCRCCWYIFILLVGFITKVSSEVPSSEVWSHWSLIRVVLWSEYSSHIPLDVHSCHLALLLVLLPPFPRLLHLFCVRSFHSTQSILLLPHCFTSSAGLQPQLVIPRLLFTSVVASPLFRFIYAVYTSIAPILVAQ